jgi:hypothetical protein
LALTLADHAMQSSDPYEKGFVKRFTKTSDLLKVMPFKKIDGSIYRYRVEELAPGVSWRDINEPLPESTGVIAGRFEELKLLGGDVFIDNFILRTQRTGGDGFDEKAAAYDAKARSMAREIERAILEGDPLVDPSEMAGLRSRLVGSQVMSAGTNGAQLTLAMLDSLVDAVSGDLGPIHLWVSKAHRRKISNLVNAIGGSVNITYSGDSKGNVNNMITHYQGMPLHVVEDSWDFSTILAFDETTGSSSITSSIYTTALGEEMGVHCIYNGNGPTVSVQDLGETLLSAAPGKVGRAEFYPGMCIKHPKAAARLRGILTG